MSMDSGKTSPILPPPVPTDDLDRNYVNLSVGASAVFAEGRSAFIQYQTLFGYEDLESHAIGVGLRIEL